MSPYDFNSAKLANAVNDITSSLAKELSQSYHNNMEILAVVGVCYIMWKGFNLLSGCYRFIKHQIFTRIFSNTKTILQYGEWAVVTGASDGIGKAYAEELASLGVNIILLGRSTEKLQNVSESISSTYRVKTRFIVADFSKGPEVFQPIKEALKDVDVGILVNNAGVFYEYPACLLEVPEEKSLDIINVNITAAVMMVYVVLPGMLQRKRGAIINVSSATSCKTVPMATVYAASKAFLDRFTVALQYEYASQGIFIQNLIPFFVITKMVDFAKGIIQKSLLVLLANEYAYSAVRTIGVSSRTAGHWSHSIQLSLGSWMPEWLWVFLWMVLNRKGRAEYLSRKKQL
ncbi:inactive hydroxysteroid dehydrogenase-like protein 1 [Eleutherodactylus coqui]|uniref:inactive hydroxysteroid dehydrogenase-like protein 1 n=1 Tax=Eleutherodactylus coqui TaxID=57060 RepID=UPI00346254B3